MLPRAKYIQIIQRIILLSLFISISFVLGSLSTRFALAQRPEPHVPCDETRNRSGSGLIGEDEFHSLRPYQASPCDPDIYEYRLYCGNDVIPVDKIIVGPYSVPENVERISCSSNTFPMTCSFRITNKDVDIDLTFEDAELPIMGNTQLVPNSNPNDDSNPQLDSAQRVNEYVSWYLNGVNNRAEEPFLSTEKKLFFSDTGLLSDIGHNKLVDFSGPIKKLLPMSTQIELRQTQVSEFAGGEGAPDNQRHDQVAGCTLGAPITIPLIGTLNLGGIPIPCYDDIGNAALLANVRQEHRLTDWENGREQPPLEFAYIGREFEEYWVDYKRWRGESCFVVEIPDFLPFIGGIGFNLCGDNPFKPNYWGDLHPYIPFGSTEDRKGDVAAGLPTIDPAGLLNVQPDPGAYDDCLAAGNTPAECAGIGGNVGLANQPTPEEGNEVTITAVKFEPKENQRRDLLFFAHMKEDTELVGYLQETYLPSGQLGYEGPGDVDREAKWDTTYYKPYTTYRCDLLDVRWNSGDDLFGEYASNETNSFGEADPKGPIEGTITYSSDEFSCTFVSEKDSCERNAMTAVSVYTRTPMADEFWGRSVAGDQSVFRRIYPKLGTAGMWEEIKDLPAVTSANYSSTAEKTLAGKPQSNRAGSDAEIFIPHLGGVLEYFLYGIQDALRPYGAQASYAPGVPGGVAPATGSCSEGVGYCDPEYLQNNVACLEGDPIRASNASKICNKESGSSPTAANIGCLDGTSYDFSIGLYQINLIAQCPEAFESLNNPFCSIKSDGTSCKHLIPELDVCNAALRDCIVHFMNVENNFDKMCDLSNGGIRFGTHWVGAAKQCGIY